MQPDARARTQCLEGARLEEQGRIGINKGVLVAGELRVRSERVCDEAICRANTYFDECGSTVGEQDRADLAAFPLIFDLADKLLRFLKFRVRT